MRGAPRAAAALLLLLGSCGYSAGLRPPLEARSLGVAVFDNDSNFPELERELYAALSDQAARMVAAEVAAPGRADLVVRGRILDYERLYGVIGVENQLLQTGVRVRLSAWLADPRSGERVGRALTFDQAVRYVIDAGEGEAGARRDALAQLSQEVLVDLLTQAEYRPESEQAPDANEPEDTAPTPLEPTAPPPTDA
jgi:hypothetical protein